MFNCDGATLLLRIGVTNFQCLQLHHFCANAFDHLVMRYGVPCQFITHTLSDLDIDLVYPIRGDSKANLMPK